MDVWKGYCIAYTVSLIGKFLGNLLYPFTGKLIQKKAFRRILYFMNSGSSHRPFYCKTHPFDFFD